MKIIVATHNDGKLREFARILEPFGLEAVGLKELGFNEDIPEDGDTFAKNAAIKARAIHARLGGPVIADDSGLCVDALGGRPGVLSARYGGEQLAHSEKIVLLLSELADVPPERRGAHFACAVCFIDAHGGEHIFEGRCHGRIGYEPRGERGFGYDPIFYVGEESFSTLSDEAKDKISHRGAVLREFAQALPELLK